MARNISVVISICLWLAMSGYGIAFGSEQHKQSGDGIYAGLHFGYANPLDDYSETNLSPTEWESDGGLNFAVAAGWDRGLYRAEGEISYRNMEMNSRYSEKTGARTGLKGDQDHLSVMLNLYWQPIVDWPVLPYAGGGFGATRISWNDVRSESSSHGISDRDTVFTYQLIAGVAYPLTSGLLLEAEYRFIAPQAPSLSDSSGQEGKLEDQELNLFSLALRYYFPGFGK